MRVSAAAAIDYPNGGTTTAQGIVAANDMLRASRRGEIPRVIVVITDGRSDDPAATTRAALDAKDEGITVFAIGEDSSHFVVKMVGGQWR